MMAQLISRTFSLSVACLLLAAGPARAQEAGSTEQAYLGENVEWIHLDLEQAVELALINNLTLQTERIGPQLSSQLLRGQQGAFDPVLEGRAGRSRTENPTLLDPFGPGDLEGTEVLSNDYEASLYGLLPWGASYRAGALTQNQRGDFNSYEDRYFSYLGVSLTQPLLRGLGAASSLAGVRLARTQDDIARLGFRQAVIDGITGTILAYNTLLFAKGTAGIAEDSHQRAMKLVNENEIRQRKGVMSEVDVLGARSRAARRETTLIRTRRAYLDAENELMRILFGSVDTKLGRKLDLEVPPQANLTEAEIDTLGASAYDRRPDFQQARLNLEQREISLAFERSQSLPQLDLVASYGLNGLDTNFGGSWGQVTDGDSDSYSVGAVVSIPLPNRTASARRQAASLRVQRSLLELKDLESRIAVQLYNASGHIETSREGVEVARKARDLADRNLKAEEKLLQNGASSTFLVLDQQERLSQAQLVELSALVSLNNAVASYERLAGQTDYDDTAERILTAEVAP